MKTYSFPRIFWVLLIFFASIVYVVSPAQGRPVCSQGLCGIGYWGAQAVDGLFHTTLISQAFETYPWMNPLAYGQSLAGYNILLDLVSSWIVHLVRLIPLADPVSTTYFVLLPAVWIVLFVHRIIILGQRRGWTHKQLTWILFFMLFGSSWEFIFPILHTGVATLEGFGGPLLTVNMHFAYSLLLLLYVMEALERQHAPSLFWKIGLGIGLMFGLKFYTGVIGCIYVCTHILVSRLYVTENMMSALHSTVIRFLPTALFSILAILALYNPLTSTQHAEPVFTFKPFALSEKLIEDPMRIPLDTIVLMRYSLQEAGWGPRLVIIQVLTLIAYFVVQIGTRILFVSHLYSTLKHRSRNAFSISLFVSSMFALAASVLLVQRGQWWNVIQFQYVGLFLLSIPAGLTLATLRDTKHVWRQVAGWVVIATTLLFSVIVLRAYTDPHQARIIPHAEHVRLQKLQSLPFGVVHVDTPTTLHPQHIAVDQDSAYVLYFSHKPGYVQSPSILQLMGVPSISQRQQEVRNGSWIDIVRVPAYVF